MNIHYYSIMAFLVFISFLLYKVSCSNDVPEDELKYIFYNKGNYCVIGENGCNANTVQDDFVSHHNFQRKFIAAKAYAGLSASNMLNMEWDQLLADGAKKYVDACFVDYPTYVGIDVCRKASAVTSFNGGVNYLRKIYEGNYPKVGERILNTVANWTMYLLNNYGGNKFDLVHLYQASGIEEDSWSQVVRATTWKFGCWLADVPTGNSGLDEFVEVIACFYGNTNLQKGEEIFKRGEPCSSCPLGTHCKEALCEVEPYKCPVPGNNFPLEGQHCPTNTEAGTEESRVLWECDIKEYGEQCKIIHPCSPIWNVDLTGHFKTITVKGDCASANVFREEVNVEVPSCFRFQYIKEGNRMQPYHTMVVGFIFNLFSGESIHVMKSEDVNNWTDVYLDIPWTGVNVQVGILVRSQSDNLRQQYITVGNFSIIEGNCS